jgi:Asp-tRNA(Asn)/Glu-tRNA(Gln) amidotransferase A subunit family amidase
VEPHRLSAVELRAAYQRGELSPVEAVDDVLARMEVVEPTINAFATATADLAREAARRAERAFRDDARSAPPLAGIPLGIKDLIETAGIRTTFGSHAYAANVPTVDAPVAARVRGAGAAVLGKTTTPEFGWKCPTDSPLLGITRNPWAPDRTPGGSSGGSAAAVACGVGPLALGTDGGGSIRQPASFCGVVGLKPSFGRVPCTPPSGTIDTFNATGVLARTTRDAALLLDVIAGDDERDWFSLPAPAARYAKLVDAGVAGLRVAWNGDLGYAAVVPEVEAIARAAALRFEELGCTVEAACDLWPDPAPWFDVLCMRMMGVGLTAYVEQWRDRVDPGLVEHVARSRGITAEAIADAAQARLQLQRRARKLFETYDLLLTPTMAVPPFAVGLHSPPSIEGTAVEGMQWTPFTFPFNATGHPAASVPAGWTRDGLPVGLQIVAGFRRDDLVLRACQAFEDAAPWGSHWPTPERLLTPS